jgi:glutamine synthetase
LYMARPDLQFTGRTLIGATAAKGQQLEDHYFGTIPERAFDFMVELELECHKLGIPLRTRHNEVAPNQFECAPMFEECNVAVDHNQLLMDIMERVAKKHKLRVLLHEKPYKGVNGSGKHNNWSMSTDTGKNLLAPGKTPKNNLLFLTTFVNIIRAVAEHDDLIRAAIASASNDHRLGANEAPPAIISVFIGSALTSVLDELESRVGDTKFDENLNQDLKLDIHNKIPDLLLDNTDRNRTSPFAFTGNKFEIRAVGSSANCAATMIVMNTIVAEQFANFKTDVEALKSAGEKQEGAIMRVLTKYIKESRNILFEGDNYSDEWAAEAEKRGLNNVKTTPPALDFYVTEKAKNLFAKASVFNHRELEARYDILCHNYTLKIQLEGRVLGELAMNKVIPAALDYQNKLITNLRGLKEMGITANDAQMTMLKEVSEYIQIVYKNSEDMIEARKQANLLTDPSAQAKSYCDTVKPYFEVIRDACDKLELIIDDNLWNLPKYAELMSL